MGRRNTLSQGFYDRILMGVISAVDQTNGYVTVMFTDQAGVRDKIPIPVIGMSGDAWIRFVPQQNDVVYVGLRGDDSAVILGWLPYNYGRRVQEFTGQGKNAAGAPGPEMMQELQPGEIDMRSKGGSYLRLNKIGDVIVMSLAGRIQMYGKEGFTEFAQLGLKITDGKSWMRFGAPFRLFSHISDRELPSSGASTPLNQPSALRERDTRLFDGAGHLLVQESLGTVIDEEGGLELSGTSGSGASHDIPKGSASGATAFSSAVAAVASLTGALNGLADHVRETVKGYATSIQADITGAIGGVASVFTTLGKTGDFADNIQKTVNDVQGIVTGAGAIASGLDGIRGLGDVGKQLRYRLLVSKDGQQKAAIDIDEDGGVVVSSESSVGLTMNANKGNLSFFGRKGIKWFAKGLVGVAETVAFSATTALKLISSGSISRAAGESIVDSAANITQAAEEEVAIGAGTKVTVQCADATIELEPGTVSVTTSGAVNITGGTVAIVGGTVTIN